jgi:hypothetical protein
MTKINIINNKKVLGKRLIKTSYQNECCFRSMKINGLYFWIYDLHPKECSGSSYRYFDNERFYQYQYRIEVFITNKYDKTMALLNNATF